MTKYTEFWNRIRNLIEKISGKSVKYKGEFIRIEFDSDQNLPVNKLLKLHNLTIVVKSVLQKDNNCRTWIHTIRILNWLLSTNLFIWMYVWDTEILQYERIDSSEGIDINKSNKSKECMICHYWYFKDIGYKLEPYVCNRCHDISMLAYDLENVAILNVKDVDYRCILWNMTRNDAVSIWKF